MVPIRQLCLTSLALFCWSLVGRADDTLDFAHGLYRQGQYKLATEEYENFLAKKPTGEEADEARFYLAESYTQLGKEDKALPLYLATLERFDKTQATSRMALFRAGQLRFHRAEFVEARPILERFQKEFPGDKLEAHASYYLGECLLSAGKLSEAEQAFSRSTSRKPEGELATNVRFGQAKLFERQEKLDAARQAYLEVAGVEKSELADDALLAVGVLDFQKKDYAGAQQVFDALQQKFPSSPLAPTARLNQGLCLYHLKQYEPASRTFEAITADRAAPERLLAEAFYRWGLSLFAKKDYARAGQVFREGAKRFGESPQGPDMVYHVGLSEFQAGAYPSAKTNLMTFVKSFGDHPLVERAYYYLARCCAETKDHAGAMAAYQALKAKFPKSEWTDRTAVTAAESALADPKLQTGAGWEELMRSVSDGGSKQRLFYLSAVAAYDAKQYPTAIERLQSVLASKPAADVAGDAQYLLGVCLVKAKRFAEALAPLEQALSANLDAAQRNATLRNLATALNQTEDGPETKRRWASLLTQASKAPDSSALLLELADGAYTKARYSSAGRAYEVALELTTKPQEKTRAYLGMGWCLHETKRSELAYEQFSQGAAVEGADPASQAESAYMAGVTGELAGKKPEAIRFLKLVFERFPQSEYWLDSGVRLASLFVKTNELTSADLVFKTLADGKVGDRKARLIYDWAWLAVDQKKPAQAGERFRKLADEFPKDPLAHEGLLKLAEFAFDAKEYEKARELTEQLERLTPSEKLLPALYYRRGISLYELGKKADARQALAQLTERFPSDRLATAGFYWLAEIDYEQGQTDKASAALQSLLKRDDGEKYRPLAQLRMAQLALQSKKWDQAITLAEPLLKGTQDASLQNEARYVLGRAFQQQSKFDDARRQFELITAGERTELAAKAQFMIGETYFHEKRHEPALKAFLKVEILYAFPEWQAMALFESGQCHEQAGDVASAKDAYQKLLDKYAMTSVIDKAKQRLTMLKK